MPARPNILVFVTDDHAPRAISAYDSSLVQTPNIDRLAKGGMRCDAAFCTNAICSPSRASILTGKYSHINGVTRFNALVGEQPTVQRALQDAGYYTAVIGKWHLGSIPTGFDHWDILPIQGEYNDGWFTNAQGTRQVPGYTTNVITDLALSVLEKRPQEQPFLVFVHHKAPHDPCTPRPDLKSLFEDKDLPVPPSLDDNFEGRSQAIQTMMSRRKQEEAQDSASDNRAPGYYSAEEKRRAEALARGETITSDGQVKIVEESEKRRWSYQQHIKDYLRCVTAVDESVGRILDQLERSGQAENTLVIYMADHGLCLGDHGLFDKRLMYDPSIRIPFLARWPARVPANKSTEKLIANVDLAPTLLEAVGLPVPKEIQGRSLLPLLSGKTPSDWRSSVYYRFYGSDSYRRGAHPPHYGVRTERYKLIYFPETAELEFYDLKTDPHEMLNLASSPTHTAVIEELKREVLRQRKALKDYDQFKDARSDLVLDYEQPDFVYQHPFPAPAASA